MEIIVTKLARNHKVEKRDSRVLKNNLSNYHFPSAFRLHSHAVITPLRHFLFRTGYRERWNLVLFALNANSNYDEAVRWIWLEIVDITGAIHPEYFSVFRASMKHETLRFTAGLVLRWGVRHSL